MTQIPYLYDSISFNRYTFISTGRYKIIKAVDFSQTTINGVYNLAFGDVLADGSLNVMAKSNNGDILKVLATVVQIIRDFTTLFPDAYIFFVGSTEERTKLYSRILRMYYAQFCKEFIIKALIKKKDSYEEVVFDPFNAFNYSAFFIKRIN
jgi:hypothetical protein